MAAAKIQGVAVYKIMHNKYGCHIVKGCGTYFLTTYQILY